MGDIAAGKNEMYTAEQLEQEASLLFGASVWSEIKEWYQYTLRKEWKYVVFVVRRSYMLALFMEKITGKKMEESSKALFLTDASIFLHCEELANAYRRNGRFPKILICDDVLKFGRNLNHILEGLENKLCAILSEFDEEEVRSAFVAAVQLHVYTRSDQPLMLLMRYQFSLHYVRKEPLSFLYQMAYNFSCLFFSANMANAAYIMSEYISEQTVQKLRQSEDYIETKYQNVVQYVKLLYVGKTSKKKAICTLRAVGNEDSNGYRAIPFVFLPNLSQAETELLLSRTLILLNDKECADWIQNLYEEAGKRSFGEVLSLLYSNVLLRAFNQKYNIKQENKDYEEELSKIIRNYNQNGIEETKKLLTSLLNVSLTMEELIGLLDDCIQDGKYVVDVRRGYTRFPDKGRIKEIQMDVEDYFYRKAFEEEQLAYQMQRAYYIDPYRRSERVVRGNAFIIKELTKDYNKLEIDYCMAYFLQLMDAGILTLSSYAPNNMKVVGLSQFSKAGEQSMLIKALRVYEYIPMLTKMQYECEQWGLEISKEIGSYGKWKKFSPEIVKLLQDFVETIAQVGQTPREWNGNYFLKVQFDEEPFDLSYAQKIMFFKMEQIKHREDYTKYAREKYYPQKK